MRYLPYRQLRKYEISTDDAGYSYLPYRQLRNVR